MKHCHLNPIVGWTKAANDSALERGSLAEWQELFEHAKCNLQFAHKILEVARQHPLPSVLPPIMCMVKLSWPEVQQGKAIELPASDPRR